MKLYVGTSGYSYKEWKGHFYPKELSEKEFLKFYGTKLNAVEINNTFYRLPKESVMQAWVEQVPEDFAFSIKASQRITHIKRLKDAGDETEYLLRVARTLKRRLGVVLFQLPPNMKKDIERLGSFLKLLAGDVRVAIEFRHPSWFDDETYALLQANDCSMCIADWDEKLDVPFVSTANWGYLRLRRENYTSADLKKWMKKIQSQDWQTAFVFFKHEDEGVGPKLAMKFLQMVE
ncbi:MAG TPA: DUF72 domain-containing protein [Bacteroidota bacterium]|nr:DUF72 domain-containing protein [Bacteroidota bacterium]